MGGGIGHLGPLPPRRRSPLCGNQSRFEIGAFAATVTRPVRPSTPARRCEIAKSTTRIFLGPMPVLWVPFGRLGFPSDRPVTFAELKVPMGPIRPARGYVGAALLLQGASRAARSGLRPIWLEGENLGRLDH